MATFGLIMLIISSTVLAIAGFRASERRNRAVHALS